MKQYTLQYEYEAGILSKALPLGNGKLGAMVFGKVNTESIALTEDSFWSGGFEARDNKDSLNYLTMIRNLVFDNDVLRAEQLLKYVFAGTPPNCREFLPLCDLLINFYHDKDVTNYKRELSLNSALCAVSYDYKGMSFKREIFISRQANVLAMRITPQNGVKTSFDARLKRDKLVDVSRNYGGNTLRLDGSSSHNGISYTAMLRAVAEDGAVFTLGDNLMVENASAATLYFTAATSYRSGYTEKTCLDTLDSACEAGFDKLLEAHIKEHTELFEAFEIEINGKDNEFNFELLAQMGRYLLISSSREGSLPAHSQGVWYKGSNIRYNLNSQNGYRLADTTNLESCYLPFFEHIKTMSQNGQKTAREVYGCRGSAAHMVTDLWGDTACSGTLDESYSPLGLAQMCNHIWEHYEHTLDITFLWDYYTLYKECAVFFLDYLVFYNNEYVTAPSVSPQNRYYNERGQKCGICMSSARDIQIIRELFTSFIKTARMFNLDNELTEQIQEFYFLLPKDKIGEHGLMAWQKDYKAVSKGSFSHLYSLYPASIINTEDTKEFTQAAKKTLTQSMDNTKISPDDKIWRLNILSRLKDTAMCMECLYDICENHLDSNMMGSNINVSLGLSTAVIGMIIASFQSKLIVLASLPEKWQSGYIKGAKIHCGVTVDIEWENGLLNYVTIYAHKTKSVEIEVIYKDGKNPVFLRPGASETLKKDDFVF